MRTPEEICPDYQEWPKRWMVTEEDLPYGRKLIELMRPFVEHLIASGLTVRTIRRHVDNLWLLGGEIIRRVIVHEQHETVSPEDNLREAIGPDGGPLCYDLDTESEVDSFDATCRKLHRFFEQHGDTMGLLS